MIMMLMMLRDNLDKAKRTAVFPRETVPSMSCIDQGAKQDGEEQKEDAAQSVCLEEDR